MERIVVVDANARGKGVRYSTLDVIGIGPRIITSLLRAYGVDATLIPYEHAISTPSLIGQYDVLAISFMISDLEAVRKLIAMWKKRNGGPILLGGPGTLHPQIDLLDYDVAIIGEAEIPLITILQRYHGIKQFIESCSESDIDLPLGVKVKKRTTSTSTLAPWAPRTIIDRIKTSIPDICNYPFYWASRVYVEVVRGCSNFYRATFTNSVKCLGCGRCRKAPLSHRIACPVNIPPGCGYCNVPLLHGPPRSRNPDIIVSEVQELISLGITRIVLSAPDFLDYGRDLLVAPEPLTDPREPPPNIDYIEKLLDRVTSIDEVREGIAAISIENVKPCLVNEYVAEVLGRYLKGSVVYIGLESGSNELLHRVGRASTVEDALRAIELLKRHGLRPYVYLMHGLPSETEDDIAKTINLIDSLVKLGVEHIILYRFRPLPRSAFEAFKAPPPAIARKSTYELYIRVKEFNMSRKAELLNKVVRVVIACKHPKRRGYLVAYPLYHGPVVLIRASTTFIGAIADAKIVNVINDRLVEGKILYVRRRVRVRLARNSDLK
ncbi:MAG TPA: radical SAM protein [Ignisphaera aggregans]|uniref:Radical SAM protein n=1 Tax=Ignisphaera aggregans TaxID=334771 RepID=A0A832Z0M9_9CREN|nr:radical SAM protein [Ignisphaera aggregans]